MKYYDIEEEKIISLEELKEEYMEKLKEDENITFNQFIHNCLTRNNGTLEEIN